MHTLNETELDTVRGASLLLLLPLVVYHIDYEAIAAKAAEQSR